MRSRAWASAPATSPTIPASSRPSPSCASTSPASAPPSTSPLRPEGGTAFERRVWTELLTIPYGETASYGEIAARIGHPGKARAVGRANGRNPIAIVCPCHRVIGSDGSLTGFGGGLENKRTLLDLEAGALTLAMDTA